MVRALDKADASYADTFKHSIISGAILPFGSLVHNASLFL